MGEITCSDPVVNSNFTPLFSLVACPMLLGTLSAFLDYFRAMMFKIFSLALLFLALIGCQTVPPLPPANLSDSGWKIQEGQAVWTSHRGEAGIAGDLTIATRGPAEAFAQFNKGPFQIV